MATAETTNPDELKDDFLPEVSQGKMGMWVFLSSEVVVFGGLILSFLLLRVGNEAWVTQQQHLLEIIGTVNTIVLLTSSWTIVMAYKAFDHDNRWWGNLWLLLTVLLGFTFLGIKAFEWYKELTPSMETLNDYSDHYQQAYAFWGFYFFMTGLHGVHVVGGVITNLIIWIGSVFDMIDDRTTRVEYAGLYWHFVDIVWVFLFPIFYLMFPLSKGGGH